jgi:hypothetical protein
MTRCTTHERARAAWVCGSCDKTLCPDCAFAKTINADEVAICVHCGGFGRVLTRPKRIAPFWEMFPRFLAAIFSTSGLIQLFAIALVQYLVSWIPLIGGFFSLFIYVSYFFRVISSASAGAEKLPEPDDFLGLESMFAPVFRFFLATALIWLPATIYLVWGIGFEALIEDPGGTLSSPVLVLLVIAGILYFPAAMIAAAVAESALAVINPMITIRLILRIPGQYLLATAIWGVLTVLNLVVMGAIGAVAQAFSIPIATPVLLNVLGLVVPVFTGFLLGRLIYQNHEHFGVMRLGDAEEPEWPGARPRAKVDPRPHTRLVDHDGASQQKPAEAIEIDFDPAPAIPGAPIQFHRPEPVPLDPAQLAPLELDLGSDDLSLPTGDLALDSSGVLLRAELPPAPALPPYEPPAALDLEDEVPLLHIGKKRPTQEMAAPKIAPPVEDELSRLRRRSIAATSGSRTSSFTRSRATPIPSSTRDRTCASPACWSARTSSRKRCAPASGRPRAT